eukprot:m.167557 g.167557  ORF g.167557 m.167557 type:complete len:367 (-) comp12841_c0_seq1:1037-2137(-)
MSSTVKTGLRVGANEVVGHTCKLCNGVGRTHVGWLTLGDPCRACGSRGYTIRRQRKCLLCGAAGKVARGWMSAGQCPACEGACFTTRKQVACRRCEGTGTTSSGVLGLSSTKCAACYGQCFVQARQFPCMKCGGEGQVRSGLLGVSRSGCSACEGAGVVHFKQHKCRRCHGEGTSRGRTCTLCEGRCYLAFDHTPCSRCDGQGKIVGWLSSTPCKACEATPGYTMMSRLDFAPQDDSDSDTAGSDTDTTWDGERDPDHSQGEYDAGSGRFSSRTRGSAPRYSKGSDDGSAYADDEGPRGPTPVTRGGHRTSSHSRTSPPPRHVIESPTVATRSGVTLWGRTVLVPALILSLFLVYRMSRVGFDREE